MGRFGHMMIYFVKKWGRFGRGCLGNGGVLVGVALVMGAFGHVFIASPFFSTRSKSRNSEHFD
jgi:hypothetical protein